MLFLSLSSLSLATIYNYNHNGADWQNLCLAGTRQSPIDIKSDVVIEADTNIEIQVNYVPMTVRAEHLPYTYEIAESFGTLMHQDLNYTMLQFHFHSPSEHTFDGVHHDLEMHIVHATEDKKTYLVVAVFFDSDNVDEDPFLQSVINADTEETEVDLNEVFVYDYLTDFYIYSGSLTTPDCNEFATWIVTDKVLSISDDQLGFFTGLWTDNKTFSEGHGNYRVTQPLFGRMVIYSEIVGYAGLLSVAFIGLVTSLMW